MLLYLYSKHTLANKNLWFKNLLVALNYPKIFEPVKPSKIKHIHMQYVGYR